MADDIIIFRNFYINKWFISIMGVFSKVSTTLNLFPDAKLVVL